MGDTLHFTDANDIKALRPPADGRIEAWDTKVRGFGLRVTSKGKRTWQIFYRFNGKMCRVSIGTADVLKLADAREMARIELARVQQGTNVAAEKQEARTADSFGELAKRYLDEWAKPRKRSWLEDQRILDVYVLPSWKNHRASEITRRDVKDLFKEVSKRGPIMANRTLALISKVYSYGLKEDIVEANPATRIDKNPKMDRERVLTEDEIRKVWAALEAETPAVQAIFKLFLLTGQRHDEVCGMRWAELNPERMWWTIPGERTKNKRLHHVPLGPQARTLVLDQTGRDETYVFPAGRFGNGFETYLYNLQKRTHAIVKRSGTEHWVIHDLRRTCFTGMRRLGVSREDCDAVLNHKVQDVAAVYDRHEGDAEKRRALLAWDREVARILSGQEPTAKKIVSIR